ncbi:MAG: hypothetical protein HY302_00940 [Opitutae bacterium]|nr:hypothetical protein [Opitutae bacterium]
MNIRTVTITVPASRDDVFNFLAQIENLPLWATEFAERVYLKDGRWRAATSLGELFVAIDADAGTGVIDLRAGPTPEQMGLFPLRVVARPGGAAASFTFFQSPGLPDELDERQYASLLVEMRGLVARFGGGELHAAPAAGE